MARVDLQSILADARGELAAQKAAEPLPELKARLADQPRPESIAARLRERPGIVAEIKARSPSMGDMRAANVAAAPAAYRAAEVVRGVSVLTNARHFGGGLDRLTALRAEIGKPVLRKDFIVEEYQVFQARAYGADALLLMVNVFDDARRLRGLYELTRTLGMDALVETHTLAELEAVAGFADWIGINSRDFRAREGFDPSRRAEGGADASVDLGTFELVARAPAAAVKIAESGIRRREDLERVFAAGFDGALIGTALLMAERGPAEKLIDLAPAN